jgi:hypothetical protein
MQRSTAVGYCAGHVEERRSTGTRLGGIALGLGFISLVPWFGLPLGLVLGPVGIVLGVTGVVYARPAIALPVTGLVVSGLSLVSSVGTIAFLWFLPSAFNRDLPQPHTTAVPGGQMEMSAGFNPHVFYSSVEAYAPVPANTPAVVRIAGPGGFARACGAAFTAHPLHESFWTDWIYKSPWERQKLAIEDQPVLTPHLGISGGAAGTYSVRVEVPPRSISMVVSYGYGSYSNPPRPAIFEIGTDPSRDACQPLVPSP